MIARGDLPCAPAANSRWQYLLNLVGRVSYPNDVGVIADICFGRFNMRVHQCGERIAFVVPVVSAWVRTKEFVCIGDPGMDTRQSAAAAGWSTSLVDDYAGLARQIYKWIERDSSPLWTTVFDDSFWELSLSDAVKALGPIRLLALKLARDGHMDVPLERMAEYFEISADVSRDDMIGRMQLLTAALTAEQLKRGVRLAILEDLRRPGWRRRSQPWCRWIAWTIWCLPS